MKKIICIFFVFTFVSMSFDFKTTQQSKLMVDKIPTSVEEFITLRDKIATTPEGGAVAFVVATIMYSNNPQIGRQAIIIQSDRKLLSECGPDKGYKGFDLGSSSDFLVRQLDQKKYIPYSYVMGTSNANGYALGNPPYNFQVSTNASSKGADGTMKVFIASTGADSPRPITLRQNDKGIWKAAEYSSIFSGVRPPVQKSKGDAGGDF
ncbi:MAG: hypothetical protein NZ529_00855 [Cytophagaceae bacterium]|nr:hypothetical protein [Cytophagaceae bacterium]MDW8455314.1 hypothetical protein [Cytophagaceae bacterium]